MDGSKRLSSPYQIPPDAAEYRFGIRGTETDVADHLFLHALLSMMQEAASLDAAACGIGPAMLDRHNLCWLLRRSTVRLDRLPGWGDTLTVKTWSRGFKRLVWDRDFVFLDSDGNSLGAAVTGWLLADQQSKRLFRPDRQFASHIQKAGSQSIFQMPAKSPEPLPDEYLDSPLLVCRAGYCDIDRVGHVNNTRYAAWCMDAVASLSMPKEFGPIAVKCFDIVYVSELLVSDEIRLYGRWADERQGQVLLIDARRGDTNKPVFHALVEIQ